MWPDPTLTAVGTLITSPSRVVFAHWPKARPNRWSYDPNPSQRFYTPGHTTSPESDSCVLLWYLLGQVGRGGSATVALSYGLKSLRPTASRQDLVKELELLCSDLTSTVNSFEGYLADILAYAAQATRRTGWDVLIAIWGLGCGALSKLGNPIPADVLASLSELNLVLTGLNTGLSLGHSGILKSTLDDWGSTLDFSKGLVGLWEQLKARIRSDLPLPGSVRGTDRFRDRLTAAINTFRSTLPDPLPAGFDVREACDRVRGLREKVRAAQRGETLGPQPGAGDEFFVSGELVRIEEQAFEVYRSWQEVRNWRTVVNLLRLGTFAGKVVVLVGTGGTSLAAEAVLSVGLAAQGITYNAIGTLQLNSEQQLVLSAVLGLLCFEHTLNRLADVTTQLTNELANSADLRDVYSRVKVESFEVTEMVVSRVAVGEVRVGIANGADSTVKVRVYGMITPIASGSISAPAGLPLGFVAFGIVELPARSTRTLSLQTVAAAPILWSSRCYLVETWVVAGYGTVIDSRSAMVAVGTSDQLSQYGTMNAQELMAGRLGEGEARETQVSLSPGSSFVAALSFPGSDLDLHVYDDTGRHVGVDYMTRQVEVGIPGATYSGPTSIPEIIALPPGGRNYRVVVVANSTDPVGEAFSVSIAELEPSPAVPQVVPDEIVLQAAPGATLVAGIGLQELAGTVGLDILQVWVSDLVSSEGVIPHGNCRVELTSTSVPPGGMVGIGLAIDVGRDNRPGLYSGEMQVRVRSAGGTVAADLAIPIKLSVEQEPSTCPSGALFCEDFEETTGWTGTGLWHFCSDACFGCTLVSGKYAHYAWPGTCSYASSVRTRGSLTSLIIPVPANTDLVVQFDLARVVESLPRMTRDRTYVQLRIGKGAWRTIWSRSSQNPSPECQTFAFGFNTKRNTQIQIRFVFDSVRRDSPALPGWAVDNVVVMLRSLVPTGVAVAEEYLDLDLEEGEAPWFVLTVTPNPVTSGRNVVFALDGVEAEGIRVQVYDVSGRLVYKAEGVGSELTWNLTDTTGRLVANGLYLAVAYARVNGEWIASDLEKVLILR